MVPRCEARSAAPLGHAGDRLGVGTAGAAAMSAPKLTPAQRDCLRAIHDAETVVLQNYGMVLGAGEFLRFAPETFLRLIGLGLIELCEPLRMRLTDAGREAAR